MSNSSLVSYTRLSPNCTKPRNHKIDTITIHCIVGQWTAKQGCDYFATTDRDCSANYVVGKDGSIGHSVDEGNRSWCSSSGSNDHRAVTIEVASDTKHPYAVTDAAYNALIKLVADICKRNGIKKLLWKADKSLIGQVGQQNMTVHRWFANKSCPGDYLYERHGAIADAVNKLLGVTTQQTTTPAPGVEMTYKVGDTVEFTGTKHYISSKSTNAKSCKAGPAKVTAVANGAKHPYHLVRVSGKGSTVYGWVDAADIAGETSDGTIKPGRKVTVNKGAKTYTGGKLASFVYKTTYEVIQVSGNRVVIGLNGQVTAAVKASDLTLV